MHCRRYLPTPVTRRAMLAQSAGGFGALALSALLQKTAAADGDAPAAHHPARATSVIYLYMDGGPSQVDSFDPKPLLDKEHGNPIRMKVPPTQFNNVGTVLKSPWAFRQHGASGLPVSELFTHIAQHADDLCVVRSMVSKFSEHTSANYFLHSGHAQQGRPSLGSWINYGLGSECDDLPGYVVLNGGLIPPGGLENFGAGFLPAAFQGSVFKHGKTPLADLAPAEGVPSDQAKKLDFLRRLDGGLLGRTGQEAAIEAAIANYELAARMQAAVPSPTWPARPRRRAAPTAWRRNTSKRGSTAPCACWRGGWSSAACGSSS
jgi:Protein of unknown function (DUF1501)